MINRLPKYQREEKTTRDFLTFNSQIHLTAKQNDLLDSIKKNKITLIIGPPGTAKTFTSCYAALELFKVKKVQKIILCKPTVIVSGSIDLGALPGSLEDKVDVFAESFYSNFKEIIRPQDFDMLKLNKDVEFKPIQYMRGCTFNNSIVLVDEFQNFHLNELMTLITRLGKNTKLIFAGDMRQNDIKTKYVAVNTLIQLTEKISGVGVFEFVKEDIVRDPILIEIINRYEKMQDEGLLPDTKL